MDNSKYLKVLLERVILTNHEFRNGSNPDSIYLVGFTEEHLDELEKNVKDALKALKKVYKIVECVNKNFIDIVEELSGIKYKTNQHAYEALKQVQLNNNIVIILKQFSLSKSKNRAAGLCHGLIKNLDDAHFDNIHPQSDLIFIDYASFLEKHFEEIGPYVVYNIWPNNQTLQEYFTQLFYLKSVSN